MTSGSCITYYQLQQCGCPRDSETRHGEDCPTVRDGQALCTPKREYSGVAFAYCPQCTMAMRRPSREGQGDYGVASSPELYSTIDPALLPQNRQSRELAFRTLQENSSPTLNINPTVPISSRPTLWQARRQRREGLPSSSPPNPTTTLPYYPVSYEAQDEINSNSEPAAILTGHSHASSPEAVADRTQTPSPITDDAQQYLPEYVRLEMRRSVEATLGGPALDERIRNRLRNFKYDPTIAATEATAPGVPSLSTHETFPTSSSRDPPGLMARQMMIRYRPEMARNTIIQDEEPLPQYAGHIERDRREDREENKADPLQAQCQKSRREPPGNDSMPTPAPRGSSISIMNINNVGRAGDARHIRAAKTPST